jgi:hypothetical protein
MNVSVMSEIDESTTSELIAAALPYWEAEAEIAKRFFASGPTNDDHIFWLNRVLKYVLVL